jgi:hypothetical protein
LTKACRANPSCGPSPFCGDGWCDQDLNREECGWDGGDCCFETCTDDETADFECGSGGFQCKDRNYARKVPDECLLDVPFPEWVGDGICDTWGYYNAPRCNYDGGDCCEDTCIHGPCNTFKCVAACPFEYPWMLG